MLAADYGLSRLLMSIYAIRRAALRGCGCATLLLTVACRAAAPAPASTPAPTEQVAPAAALGPKVAFLGDSISAGLHLAADEAFPAALQRKLAARGVAFQLVNAGVSGDTSAGGLRRVDWLLKQHPRVIVIELGGNDGLRGIPVAVTEQNLRAIVTKIRAGGAEPLLLGMRIPPSVGEAYAEEFAAIYPRVAAELNVPFVPFFMEGVAGVPELNLEDGIHPTALGHERIATHLVESLQKLLE
jgi:acyl-CoA thioesterase-1